MPAASSRPYRSHKYPACANCRRRKARCLIEGKDAACRLCRERGLECSIDVHSSSAARRSIAAKNKDRSVAATGSCRIASRTVDSGRSPDDHNEASLLVNSAMAEDVTIVQTSLLNTANELTSSTQNASRYTTIQTEHQEPVVYSRIPRSRVGKRLDSPKALVHLETIENVLRGQTDELLDLFFERTFPHFPVVDENRDAKRSPALLCTMYVVPTLTWSSMDVAKTLPRPDMAFLWNQAVAAIREEFMAPNLTTVQASLLSMVGRPIYGIQDNVLDCGRTVALALGLGLHRSPVQWNLSQAEKNLRIRVWWGILIHDAWSSLAHGTPPMIRPSCCDVPIPTDIASGSFFRLLCQLTTILTRILPLVYNVNQSDKTFANEAALQLEEDLDVWGTKFYNAWKPSKHGKVHTDGASGLWFCYLILRLLLSRLALKGQRSSGDSFNVDQHEYMSKLKAAAIDIATYTTSLIHPNLDEFWLPYTAHLLVSATTMLLRCAVEATNMETKRDCVIHLDSLKKHLEWAKSEHDWELGDFTIERCGDAIQRLVLMLDNVQEGGSPDQRPQATEIPLTRLSSSHQWLSDDFGFDFANTMWTDTIESWWNVEEA